MRGDLRQPNVFQVDAAEVTSPDLIQRRAQSLAGQFASMSDFTLSALDDFDPQGAFSVA